MSDHVASTGVMSDSKYRDDDDYVNEVVAGAKPARKLPTYTKLPISEIAASLEHSRIPFEEGSDEYRRARLADRAACVLCGQFEHWNRQLLKEHYQKHEEIRQYNKSVQTAKEAYDALVQRRARIKSQIEILRREFVDVDRRIANFDLAEHAAEQRRADRLFKLVGF